MDKKDPSRPPKGHRLMYWLMREASRRDMNLTDLAEALEISRPYLYALRQGQRPTDGLDRSVLSRMATFLNKPIAALYLAAEIITASDFYSGSERALLRECDRAIDFILDDPDWGAGCPDTTNFTLDEKLFVVEAYQQATQRVLLPKRETIGFQSEGHLHEPAPQKKNAR